MCGIMDATKIIKYQIKWSKSRKREKYDIIYTQNLKHSTNEPIQETDSQT